MQCLPPNVISTVAEDTSKLTMNEPTFEWWKKKKRRKREFPNSMMKDINPFRQNNNNNNNKICSSPNGLKLQEEASCLEDSNIAVKTEDLKPDSNLDD
ncbi:hypothetical protein TNCV_2345991 [Trichonephila clavipes]|nr:hypothetical protein TNCV_2345991 [Trichonephila clavipes]